MSEMAICWVTTTPHRPSVQSMYIERESHTHLFILISRDGDELGLLEDISAKRAVGQLEDVVGAHQMKSRLVLVH